MNIAIVDDDSLDALKTASFADQYFKSVKMSVRISTFFDPRSFLDSLHTIKYALTVLDVYMEGMNGIEAAFQMRKKDDKCVLIFSTNSIEHAISGYKVSASDYLLKPYSYEEFAQALDRCKKGFVRPYIEIKESRIMMKVFADEILYADYFNHYVQVHTEKRTIRTYMPFSDFRIMLNPYPQFLNCYRNCVINMDKVVKMDKSDFLMTNGMRIPMPAKQRGTLHQLYSDYMFEKVRCL